MTCILRTGDGALWVGTRGGGLARHARGEWTLYGADAGLENGLVSCLLSAPSAGGRPALFVGTYGGGLFVLEQGAERLVPVTAELPSGAVTGLQRDRHGRLYVFTNRGAARLTPGGEGVRVYGYTVEDGLPSEECLPGASYRDRAGRVFTGTAAGAAALHPERERRDPAPPPLTLERMLVNGAAGAGPGGEIPHRPRSVAFGFALLSGFRAGDARFRTQLAGLDEKPSDWSSETRKEYTTLPPGSYVFRVWGRDHAGNQTAPVEVPFHVSAPPWLTWWAFLGYAGLIAAGAAVILRAHRSALARHAAAVEARLGERTRQLEESLARRAESKVRVLRDNRRLHEVQEKLDRLAATSLDALKDVDSWSLAVAHEMAESVNARRIAVWRIEDGALLRPVPAHHNGNGNGHGSSARPRSTTRRRWSRSRSWPAAARTSRPTRSSWRSPGSAARSSEPCAPRGS